MPRFCMSFLVNTSTLKGTSCRFSSRLRAVTTTSARPPELELSASAASDGPRGTANPARAAATANPTFEPDPRVNVVGKEVTAGFRLRERIRKPHERLLLSTALTHELKTLSDHPLSAGP